MLITVDLFFPFLFKDYLTINNKMFNPLAQLKLISDELGKESSDDNKLGIIQALGIKFLFAFVLVFCIFVYLDKTSSLNGRSPEENKKLHKMGYKEEEVKEEVKEEKAVGSSTGVSKGDKVKKSRKL